MSEANAGRSGPAHPDFAGRDGPAPRDSASGGARPLGAHMSPLVAWALAIVGRYALGGILTFGFRYTIASFDGMLLKPITTATLDEALKGVAK
ncbi:MAG: hypothetical protein IJT64_03385 [Kiritimatiellae bacterium]|nr:hypothetical protein [Kiritimatiellia bacterium]